MVAYYNDLSTIDGQQKTTRLHACALSACFVRLMLAENNKTACMHAPRRLRLAAVPTQDASRKKTAAETLICPPLRGGVLKLHDLLEAFPICIAVADPGHIVE